VRSGSQTENPVAGCIGFCNTKRAMRRRKGPRKGGKFLERHLNQPPKPGGRNRQDRVAKRNSYPVKATISSLYVAFAEKGGGGSDEEKGMKEEE